MCPIKPVLIYDGHSSSDGEEVVHAPFSEINEDDILDDLEDLEEDLEGFEFFGEEFLVDIFVEIFEENLEEVAGGVEAGAEGGAEDGAEGSAEDGAEGGAEDGARGRAPFGGPLDIVPPNLRGVVASIAHSLNADFIGDYAAGYGFRYLVERDPEDLLRRSAEIFISLLQNGAELREGFEIGDFDIHEHSYPDGEWYPPGPRIPRDSDDEEINQVD